MSQISNINQTNQNLADTTAKINTTPPMIQDGEIWLCQLGESVITEPSKKSQVRRTLCAVYKKLSPHYFMVVPCARNFKKQGSWYIPFNQDDNKMTALLNKAGTINHKRMDEKIGTLDSQTFAKIASEFNRLYISVDTENSTEEK